MTKESHRKLWIRTKFIWLSVMVEPIRFEQPHNSAPTIMWCDHSFYVLSISANYVKKLVPFYYYHDRDQICFYIYVEGGIYMCYRDLLYRYWRP